MWTSTTVWLPILPHPLQPKWAEIRPARIGAHSIWIPRSSWSEAFTCNLFSGIQTSLKAKKHMWEMHPSLLGDSYVESTIPIKLWLWFGKSGWLWSPIEKPSNSMLKSKLKSPNWSKKYHSFLARWWIIQATRLSERRWCHCSRKSLSLFSGKSPDDLLVLIRSEILTGKCQIDSKRIKTILAWRVSLLSFISPTSSMRL